METAAAVATTIEQLSSIFMTKTSAMMKKASNVSENLFISAQFANENSQRENYQA